MSPSASLRRLLDPQRQLAQLGLDPQAPAAYWLLALIFRLPPHAELLRRLAPYFPHIDLCRLRWADALRLPLQVLWLLLVRPANERRSHCGPLIRIVRQTTTALCQRIDTNWLRRQADRERGFAYSRLEQRLAHISHNPPRHAVLLWLPAILLLATVASNPLGAMQQAGLGAMLLGCLLLLGRSGGARVHLLASGIVLALALRYFWWRASVTLDFADQTTLTLALLLLLAEIRLWSSIVFSPWRTPTLLLQATAGLAHLACLAAPALAVLGGVTLIDAEPAILALYAVPHGLATLLLRQHSTSSGLYLATRATALQASLFPPSNGKVGAGGTALGLLTWANWAVLLAGTALLLSDAIPGLLPLYLAWAAFNLTCLGLAASPALARSVLYPSQILPLAMAQQGALLLAPLRACTPLRRFGVWLAWWLPHAPRAAMPFSLTLGLSALLLLLLPQPSTAQHPDVLPSSADLMQSPDMIRSAEQVNPERLTRRLSFRELSGRRSLPLRTSDGSTSIYFGQRADELVVAARLRLRYTHSPALLPDDSHIKVLLNDEMIGIAPIRREAAGNTLTEEFEIDPRFIADRNELRFRFIGHYTQTCEDPMRNSLWADISGSSELEIGYAPLTLHDDLSRLPEPFFDKRDLRTLVLPVVFSPTPGLPTLNAAGIVTSWFGKLAGDRGAQFPPQMGMLQPGHGIVIATNAERPPFMRGRPLVDGPTIEIITNPVDGVSKLLLVQGRDGIDVAEAAKALVLGHAAMTGTKVTIRSRRDDAPRQAYDAPNWARSDRPTRLGEMIAYPQQLQASGHQPPPLKLDVRVPPDLFAVGKRDVPMQLRYRYSPPMRGGDNLLSFGLNGTLVQSWSLAPKPAASGVERLLRGDAPLAVEEQRLALPADRIKGRNRLNFDFAFARYQEGPCPDVPPDDSRRALIDPESTIDLSGFHHFARMPNLNHFATVGFPFTKYADLSQTVIVMSDRPTKEEIETALNLLGQFSRATGVPASKVRVVGPNDESLLEDADLLVIGNAMGQGVLARWPDYVPADIAGNLRRISQPARARNFLYDWLGFTEDTDDVIVSQDKFTADGPLALIVGFRSPLSTTRSVVAVMATAPDQLWQAGNALNDEFLSSRIHGSVAFVRGTQVDSFRVGESYFVGELPWWVTIWFPLSLHPLLLALLSILSAVLLSLAWAWRRTRRTPIKPGDDDEDD